MMAVTKTSYTYIFENIIFIADTSIIDISKYPPSLTCSVSFSFLSGFLIRYSAINTADVIK